ncbi:MAG: SOS response-associated peptidase family protein [Atopobiaceae bacterium]|nr:SOS response-associated peptidase family protein [Atopobiaceae bacterium]
MCHRVMPVLMTEIEYLLEQQRQTGHARLPERDPSLEVPDAYPGKQLPLIVPDATGELHAEELTWGFDAPPGARSKLVFNTRIETALAHVSAGRGMWAEPLLIGRCLIPVLAFYESWTRNPPRRGAQARFSSPAHRGFLLAGVQAKGRVSIVTTQPNAAVSPLHTRMPLVLGPGESNVWLQGDYASLADRSQIRLDIETL